MIYCNNVFLSFGGQQVFDNLSWALPTGKRVGLIGPNGAGKSTLLRLLSGRLQVDAGTISYEGNATIGYLEQDVQEAGPRQTVLDEALLAFEDVLEAERDMDRIARELDEISDHGSEHYTRLLAAMDRAQSVLQAKESHTIRPRAEAVLTGLGFEADELDRPLATYSGGWRMRATLARILLSNPAILLLDEPTNHLDIESIDWLEQYLKNYNGTVVIVSHDRYFLDRMVDHTSEIAHGRITDFSGNYSFYLTERVARRELQQSAYDNQQREIAETERFIERFRYKATKATQVQSRIKHLDKLERVLPPPSEAAKIGFRFPEPPRSGRTVLELSSFSKTYEGDTGPIHVFDRAGPFTIERGDKIALIGKNGAGKSTLARILNGREVFDGARSEGYHVVRTFFAQHQAETLNPSDSVLDALRAEAHGQGETELRSLLGAFLFTGDDVFKPVSVLSGGERSRLALARTLLSPANFLILDEPTNHLDIQSIQVLIDALKQYKGTFVVVSHDRHFLDAVSNRIWAVGGGGVHDFPGTYSEYRWSLEKGSARAVATTSVETAPSRPKPSSSGGPKTKEQKRREAEERQQQKKTVANGDAKGIEQLSPAQQKRAYERVEKEVFRLEARIEELEAQMADPEVFGDPDALRGVAADHQAATAELAGKMQRWEELAGIVAADESR